MGKRLSYAWYQFNRKLANCLGVNVSEILKGEKINNMTKMGSDEIVKVSIPFFQKKYFKVK